MSQFPEIYANFKNKRRIIRRIARTKTQPFHLIFNV